MYVDGSSTMDGSGIGILLISPQGDEIKLAVQLHFWTSNNETESDTLLVELSISRNTIANRIEIYLDSQSMALRGNG